MTFVGLALALAGFLLGVFSLSMSSDVTVRMIMVLAGIAVSIVGIGLINKAFLSNAIWRK